MNNKEENSLDFFWMSSKNSASEGESEHKLAPLLHVVFAQVMKLIRANVSQLLVTTKFQEFVCDYLERVNPIQDAAAQVELLTTLRYKWREEVGIDTCK